MTIKNIPLNELPPCSANGWINKRSDNYFLSRAYEKVVPIKSNYSYISAITSANLELQVNKNVVTDIVAQNALENELQIYTDSFWGALKNLKLRSFNTYKKEDIAILLEAIFGNGQAVKNNYFRLVEEVIDYKALLIENIFLLLANLEQIKNNPRMRLAVIPFKIEEMFPTSNYAFLESMLQFWLSTAYIDNKEGARSNIGFIRSLGGFTLSGTCFHTFECLDGSTIKYVDSSLGEMRKIFNDFQRQTIIRNEKFLCDEKFVPYSLKKVIQILKIKTSPKSIDDAMRKLERKLLLLKNNSQK